MQKGVNYDFAKIRKLSDMAKESFQQWQDLGYSIPFAAMSLRTGGRIRSFLAPLTHFLTPSGIITHPPRENRFQGHFRAFFDFLHPYGVEMWGKGRVQPKEMDKKNFLM